MPDPVALVTGGARGIGAAVCRKLSLEGYHVVVNYHHSADSAKALVEELSARRRAISYAADVSKPEEVEALFEVCRKEFGRLDVLVNNASYSSTRSWNRPVDEIDWSEWQKTIDIDVKGTMLCSHAAYRMMKPRAGKIINFSSSAALYGDVPTYFYTAAKSAVAAITKTLARAFAPNVQVNCIAPGSIGTDWIQRWKLTPKDLDDIRNENLMKRIGTPEEVADLVSFLASPKCTFITGQTLVIDGGILML